MTTQPHKRAKIIGPAGCGKTTYLLNLLEQAANKYAPERIGAVSLTNAAIEEMRDRVRKVTKLSSETARNIRTIHSTCFNLLGLKRDQVADKQIAEFNKAYPKWQMPLNTELTEDEHYSEHGQQFTPEENKKRFATIQTLRHQMVPEEQWEDRTLADMYFDWKRWMHENQYVDFTGMMELVLWQGLRPDIDILLVDEAQDVSRLSMSVLELWSEECVSTVYVGDSDQAILRFAGAVPEAFINLDTAWRRILGKSYRVPQAAYEYAMGIIKQAKNRENVEYKPTEIEGQVIKGCNEPDLSLEGTHMILGRCNYHLNRWINWLRERNVLYHNPYRPGDKTWNPMNTKLWRSARSYVRLLKGEELRVGEFREMVKEMVANGNLIRGAKKDLDDVLEVSGFKRDGLEKIDLFGVIPLGLFTDEFLSFKKEVVDVFKVKGPSGEILLRTEDIFAKPRVVIGTIHCSPPDERILTMDGWIPLGNLEPDTHRLAGYLRKCNQLAWGGENGPNKTRKNGGYKFTKRDWDYAGDLVTISTDESITRVTPEHNVLAKFSENFVNKYVVYLMRRGTWWRVGICISAHRPYRSGGIGGRLATEQADSGWILGIFATREEAIYEEARIQSLYGIPGLTFQTVSKGRALTTDQLHSIHTETQSQVNIRVKKLLRNFNLHAGWPLYRRGFLGSNGIKRNMRGLFETRAANLISDYMMVPVIPKSFEQHGSGIQKPKFFKIKISREKYIGKISSLEVSPFPYYISGGAVVHNSVKGGECDHVWVDSSTSRRCLLGCIRNEEIYWDECRVGYVGVTRGFRTVGVLLNVGYKGRVW